MDSRGFAMVELLVSLAIIVMIAATVVPVLVGSLDRARVERAATSLAALGEAIEQFEEDVNDWPGALSQLTTTISTSMTDSCGSTFSNGDVNNWAGPYLMRIVPSTGLNVFIGVADNTLDRIPMGGSSAILRIQIPAVTEDDILELDRQVDASDGRLSGTISWETPVNGLALAYYGFAISGC